MTSAGYAGPGFSAEFSDPGRSAARAVHCRQKTMRAVNGKKHTPDARAAWLPTPREKSRRGMRKALAFPGRALRASGPAEGDISRRSRGASQRAPSAAAVSAKRFTCRTPPEGACTPRPDGTARHPEASPSGRCGCAPGRAHIRPRPSWPWPSWQRRWFRF